MSDFDIIPENIWISLEKAEVPKFGLTISFKVEVDIARSRHVIFEGKLMYGFEPVQENV